MLSDHIVNANDGHTACEVSTQHDDMDAPTLPTPAWIWQPQTERWECGDDGSVCTISHVSDAAHKLVEAWRTHDTLSAAQKDISASTKPIYVHKTKCWAWYVWPTSRVGRRDPHGTAIKTDEDVRFILECPSAIHKWVSVLDDITRILQLQQDAGSTAFLKSLNDLDRHRVQQFCAEWETSTRQHILKDHPQVATAVQSFITTWRASQCHGRAQPNGAIKAKPILGESPPESGTHLPYPEATRTDAGATSILNRPAHCVRGRPTSENATDGQGNHLPSGTSSSRPSAAPTDPSTLPLGAPQYCLKDRVVTDPAAEREGLSVGLGMVNSDRLISPEVVGAENPPHTTSKELLCDPAYKTRDDTRLTVKAQASPTPDSSTEEEEEEQPIEKMAPSLQIALHQLLTETPSTSETIAEPNTQEVVVEATSTTTT